MGLWAYRVLCIRGLRPVKGTRIHEGNTLLLSTGCLPLDAAWRSGIHTLRLVAFTTANANVTYPFLQVAASLVGVEQEEGLAMLGRAVGRFSESSNYGYHPTAYVVEVHLGRLITNFPCMALHTRVRGVSWREGRIWLMPPRNGVKGLAWHSPEETDSGLVENRRPEFGAFSIKYTPVSTRRGH